MEYSRGGETQGGGERNAALGGGGDTAEQKEKKKVPRKCPPRVCGGREQRGETRTMAYNELFRSQDPSYLVVFFPL